MVYLLTCNGIGEGGRVPNQALAWLGVIMARSPKPCAECGQLTAKRSSRTDAPLHAECGITRAARAAREMAARSGPAWDTFVASGRAAGRRDIVRHPDGRFAPAEPAQQ